jgi:hypothetical protein
MMHKLSFKVTVEVEVTDAALVIAKAKATHPDFWVPGEVLARSDLDHALLLLLDPEVDEDHPGLGNLEFINTELVGGDDDAPVS